MRRVSFIADQELFAHLASLPKSSYLIWQNANYSVGDVIVIKSQLDGQELHKRVLRKDGEGNYCSLQVESLTLLPLAERLQRSSDYFALPIPDCGDLALRDATCEGYPMLVGLTDEGQGVFLVRGLDGKLGDLDSEAYLALLGEAKEAGLKSPFHVCARYEVFQSSSVVFHKLIPQKFEELYENEST